MRIRDNGAPILHFQIPPEYSQITVDEFSFWYKTLSKALPEYRIIISPFTPSSINENAENINLSQKGFTDAEWNDLMTKVRQTEQDSIKELW